MIYLRRYFLATAIALLSLLIQYGLVVSTGVPSLGIFYPFIFLCAYFLDFGAAALVTLITAIGAAYFFSYSGSPYSPGPLVDLLRHAIFLVLALSSSWLLDRARLIRYELVRAKEEAVHARRRLDEFFAKAPIPMAVLTGLDFRFELANAEYRKLVGSKRSILGRPLVEALPDVPAEIGEILRRVYQSGERFIGQQYPQFLDWEDSGKPSLKYLDFIYEPLVGPKGTEGIMVFAYDVTELVQNRKALEESEQRIRAYAEAMPQMAFIASGDGSILYFNARWYAYVGVNPGETEGWSWRDKGIHHPDDMAPTVALWNESIKTGKPYEVQYRLRRHDGEYRWHLGRATPVRDREGNVVRWFGTNTDIHEQKLIQEELSRAVRARDDFLSVAAHELRTPVTALLLQSQLRGRLLARQGHEYFTLERLKEMFAQDQRQADRLARLMDDILDVSQLSRDRFILQLTELDLSALAADVVERLRPLFQVKEVSITYTSAGPARANVDAVRIERAISNLVLNSLKYGEDTPVEVRVANEGGHVVLSVSDGGPGIKAADQERIFRRFERANPTSDVTGLGLGLYITREIVEAHGGVLEVESEPRVATTFRIKLNPA